MSNFPSNTQENWFHHRGANDIYRLPRMAMYGSCKVTVDLEIPNAFEASWSSVWSMALMLKEACAVYGTGPIHAGEIWTAGELRAGLKISIGRYDYGAANLTAIDAGGSIAES